MKRVHKAVIGLVGLMFATMAMAAGERADESAMKEDSMKSVSAPDLSSSYKSSDLAGLDVKNRNDEDIGSISELIVDKDGKVSHVLLSKGGVAGVGADSYIVPWDRVQLSPDENVAIIDVPQDAIESEFAAFDEDKVKTAGDKAKKHGSKESKDDSRMRSE